MSFYECPKCGGLPGITHCCTDSRTQLAPQKAEAVPQWIEPHEKTPEDGQECLVYSRQHWEKAPSVKLDTWQEQHEAPLSFSSATIPIGVGWDAHNFEDVIAWMPLPAAPQPKATT